MNELLNLSRAENTLLSAQWTESLPDYIVEIMQQISVETSKIIAARIKYIGELKPTDVKKLTNAMEFAGADIRKIEKVIAKYTKLSEKEIDKLFFDYAQKNDEFARVFYEARGITPKTYRNDAFLNSVVNSIAEQTKMNIGNLSRTTALFYKMPDNTYLDINQTYIRTINQAIYEVQSGTLDYNTAMRTTLKSLGKGARTLEYMSGYKKDLTAQ